MLNPFLNRIKLLLKSIKRIIRLKPHDESSTDGISDERYRRIFLSGGSTLIVKFVSIAINLITVPLTLSFLGAERYGLWMAISSIMALMAFADLGLGNGLLNVVSKAKGDKNNEEAKIAVSSTFFILLCISLLLLTLFFIAYPYINWVKVFNVKTEIAKIEAGPTVIALIIPMLINMPLGIVQRIQEGNQEGYKFQLFLILGSIISFLSILLCIYLKSSLPLLVLAYSIGPIIATVINGLIMFRKNYPFYRPRFHLFNLDVGKELLKVGLVFFILQIFTLLANASDNIILAQTMGASSVAQYEIVKKIFLFSMITQFIIQPLWPAFGEALAKGDMIWIKKTIKNALILSLGVNVIITLPLVLFGRQLISMWVGSAYMPSWSLLIGFFMFTLLANYGGVMSTFLNSGKLISKQTIIIALASISAIFLKIYLSLNIGISGIIWATVIGYSIFYVYPSYKLVFSFLNKKN
jgi:O-antigen/teichoic acid export membrane protein